MNPFLGLQPGQLFEYLSVLDVILSAVASGHVILTKRDTRAAIAWIGLIWLSPLVGITLYTLLGINRIERQGRQLRKGRPRIALPSSPPAPPGLLRETLGEGREHLASLAELIDRVTLRPLRPGNEVTPLHDGDRAFEAMLDAIAAAAGSVSLSSYIFNDDRVGRRFVGALKGAVDRGVEVRVLVDDVGARYDWPRIVRPLRRAGVPTATFLPTLVPGWFPYLNLRDHRKILVVDGRVGFTGGMNIDETHALSLRPKFPTHDLHFRLLGPVVADLQHVFAEDWAFCTGESLDGPAWFPALEADGPMLARGIVDGPDEDRDKLEFALLGALSCARSRVVVVTPYFLPDAVLISALTVAALRGVAVDIVLPERNNLAVVKWASTAKLDLIVDHGCRVWAAPPPFDHTKLMLVDEAWSFFGSGNWDPRSLRLNFEFNVECYSRPLAMSLGRAIDARIRVSKPVTRDVLDARSLPVKLRDGVASLFSPYL